MCDSTISPLQNKALRTIIKHAVDIKEMTPTQCNHPPPMTEEDIRKIYKLADMIVEWAHAVRDS